MAGFQGVRASCRWGPREVDCCRSAGGKIRDRICPNRRPPLMSRSVTLKLPVACVPRFSTVTVTVTVWPTTTGVGTSMPVTATSVVGSGTAPPSTVTPNRFKTRSIRLTMVWVSLPAKSKPTGRLWLSTTSDPESPPALKVPGVTMSWSVKRAMFIQFAS